jgi:hypothetical protein
LSHLHLSWFVTSTETSTVGANAGVAADPAQDFKAQEGMSLDEVHAGDRVNYSAMVAGTPRGTSERKCVGD